MPYFTTVRRHRDLLHRPGHRPARPPQPRLAAELRRLAGRAEAPRRQRLPRHRPRPPRPRPLVADRGRATTWTPTPATSPSSSRRSTCATSWSSGTRPAAARSCATPRSTAPAGSRRSITAGAVPPVMVKSDTNPEGTPIEAFDGIRAGVLKDRSQFYQDLTDAVLRRQPRGRRRVAGRHVTTSGARACSSTSPPPTTASRPSPRPTSPRTSRPSTCRSSSPTATTTRSCRSRAAALKSVELVKHGTLKVYPGAPHGIYGDYQEELDHDILAFIAG